MPVSPLRVLSLIPPMTQLNTPYPSTAYITGFLRQEGVVAEQADLAIELVLRLFSKTGLTRVHERALQLPKRERSAQVVHFLANFEAYSGSVDAVIRFLQGRDATLAYRICGGSFLPEGARFGALGEYLVGEDEDPLGWAFGSLGLQDRARHLATLYLNDLADVLRDAVDSRFEFVRYAESIAQSAPSFDPLARALAEPFNLIDETLQALTCEVLARHAPQVVLVSVPFPGSVYGAFRIAQAIKATHPDLPVVLGGGYVNTELRDLAEPRVFDYFDFVTLDDGERPLLALLEHLGGARLRERLVRTFVREAGRVRYVHFPEPDVPFDRVGAPTWDGLPIDRYLSVLDMLNPMHRLWSDGRWNKLTVAHGCYWKKCSFCDVSLDYISRYETANAAILVDRIEAIVAETGQSGFHFVDEAAPPKALRAMAEELLLRNLSITWWGNVRFEKSFTPELCGLLAASGCIAISGGLEVASDRLLKLMKKGVSVEQVARVTHAFSQAGILVHAYLMYGFPTQTEQDTVDALEYVRQLFAEGCIQSGFFHRFACTVHSPVGQHPEEYGIELVKHGRGSFGNNDVPFIDPTGVDHAMLGRALSKAIYNFMHGIGLDQDVRQWFEECRVPRPQVSKRFIERALAARGTA
ncbi:MAG: radical SAM protein [Candidatus Dactylopiibacterium carminicum]|uniref:Radical SAM protein n=1 Tax=Candidatus Dactylopiibacterium carminicum TaxID=857335 RepID=A0A272ETN8_9RHOO|nr:radical SAM protein [Candidatus Dactylopiibacterium carminicum]KAF7599426.1 radical SAM protein [Candidatus Dactylopiibacterium carminicum]PAS93416.1 MAG: radical SAM protein [Candidatus Dactylopiibacterium carminicum]PAS95935.1 MAG: radical SAM protein [Candidatus Dactylopiibacterium carminicum]PAS99434.1 MAG: radical SAM protein [Candidatus Dactylopiibacterium carminicum]